jgi:hypothetical protein
MCNNRFVTFEEETQLAREALIGPMVRYKDKGPPSDPSHFAIKNGEITKERINDKTKLYVHAC